MKLEMMKREFGLNSKPKEYLYAFDLSTANGIPYINKR